VCHLVAPDNDLVVIGGTQRFQQEQNWQVTYNKT